jgi:hypothetical protein
MCAKNLRPTVLRIGVNSPAACHRIRGRGHHSEAFINGSLDVDYQESKPVPTGFWDDLDARPRPPSGPSNVTPLTILVVCACRQMTHAREKGLTADCREPFLLYMEARRECYLFPRLRTQPRPSPAIPIIDQMAMLAGSGTWANPTRPVKYNSSKPSLMSAILSSTSTLQSGCALN